jgi:predicted transcriptional regulator
MTKIDEIKINKIIHRLGLKYNLSDSIIKELVESPGEFTFNTFKELFSNNAQRLRCEDAYVYITINV